MRARCVCVCVFLRARCVCVCFCVLGARVCVCVPAWVCVILRARRVCVFLRARRVCARVYVCVFLRARRVCVHVRVRVCVCVGLTEAGVDVAQHPGGLDVEGVDVRYGLHLDALLQQQSLDVLALRQDPHCVGGGAMDLQLEYYTMY